MKSYEELLAEYKEASNIGINFEYHKQYIPCNVDMKWKKNGPTIRKLSENHFQLYYVDSDGGHDIEGRNLNQVCSQYWKSQLTPIQMECFNIPNKKTLLIKCKDCAASFHAKLDVSECENCNGTNFKKHTKLWFRGQIYDEILIYGKTIRNYYKEILGHAPTWARYEKELAKAKENGVQADIAGLIKEIENEDDDDEDDDDDTDEDDDEDDDDEDVIFVEPVSYRNPEQKDVPLGRKLYKPKPNKLDL